MKQKASAIIPGMRYKDAPAAIEWLCKAFRFEKHLVVEGEDGSIAHAQLTFGQAMIMLGSDNDNAYGKHFKTPGDLDGINTMAAYIVVKDVDEHYRSALAAGAEIVMDIKDEDYGGRGYSCKDPEGYIWNFGSYDPWAS